MSMRSDHKALLFLAAIAALGATVRVARAIGAPTPAGGAALEHQMQAADSAKRSLAAKRQDKNGRQTQAKSAGRKAGIVQPPSSAGAAATHRDYKGRLDLDVASAAEIDALPGMGPALSKRIVADRMANGAFRELIALRRVKGVNAKLLTALDSLVSFSGIYKTPQASDTVLTAKPSRKRR
jgi:competence protein ComEA